MEPKQVLMTTKKYLKIGNKNKKNGNIEKDEE
jgi:hypothetical protein